MYIIQQKILSVRFSGSRGGNEQMVVRGEWTKCEHTRVLT